ncbi:MAG: 50S ribosomal protein L18e [Nanoarchaeota archaeon]|nr:50S ribosomal protein L18e [Nanoarchaeota archaeon]
MAKSTNPGLNGLIKELNSLSAKKNVRIWKRLASDLERPNRIRRIINIEKLNKYAKEGETIAVPGKVLGDCGLKQKLTVAAWQFSQSAKEQINKNGKAISLKQLMKDNPKGKKVRILG